MIKRQRRENSCALENKKKTRKDITIVTVSFRPKIVKIKLSNVDKRTAMQFLPSLLFMLSATLVRGTGEWSEDAEDLGE